LERWKIFQKTPVTTANSTAPQYRRSATFPDRTSKFNPKFCKWIITATAKADYQEERGEIPPITIDIGHPKEFSDRAHDGTIARRKKPNFFAEDLTPAPVGYQTRI